MAVVKLGRIVKATKTGSTIGIRCVLDYIMNPDKTLGGTLVSSNFTAPTNDSGLLASIMENDLRATPHGIVGGEHASRLIYHVKLSFAPEDNLTPERVHELGMEFAERITHGNNKYVIATHTDRPHLHDHIAICAANTMTGLKWHPEKTIIDQWRLIADDMCKREHLHVITPMLVSNGTIPMCMQELYATLKGTSVKQDIRARIELACAQVTSFTEFTRVLKDTGISVSVRGKHVSFTVDATGFKVRDTRLGAAYTPSMIMTRLAQSTVLEMSFHTSLIANQTGKSVTVWIPGTHRTQKISFKKTWTIPGETTWRVFIPRTTRLMIQNKQGRFLKQLHAAGLYKYFQQPQTLDMQVDISKHLPHEKIGVSLAQQRYYAYQQQKLDVLSDKVTALNTILEYQSPTHSDLQAIISQVQQEVARARSQVSACVIALQEAISQADTTLVVETHHAKQEREQELDELTRKLNALTRVLTSRDTREVTVEKTRTTQREQPTHNIKH